MSEQITITETYGSPGYSYRVNGVGTYSVVKGAGFRWQIRLRPDGLEPHVPGQGGAGIVSVGSVSQGCYGSPGVPACGNPTAREEWAAKIRSHAAKMIG